jgi:hypothetical protein
MNYARESSRQGDGLSTDQKFFFIHVMKTAGGTLRRQILANFDRAEVYPLKRLDPDMRTANYGLDYLTGLPPARRAQIRVFTGHFPFVAVELLGMELTTITILRDPIERTLSYLRHCQRYHKKHRGLSLEEIYGDPFFHPSFIMNHQAKLFALTVDDDPQSYMDVLEVDAHRLALAKSNLERVDVVGTQDRFGELLGELEERFGWQIAPVVDKHVNRGGNVPGSFRRRIAEDNRADVEFYEYARGLCERRRVAGVMR